MKSYLHAYTSVSLLRGVWRLNADLISFGTVGSLFLMFGVVKRLLMILHCLRLVFGGCCGLPFTCFGGLFPGCANLFQFGYWMPRRVCTYAINLIVSIYPVLIPLGR